MASFTLYFGLAITLQVFWEFKFTQGQGSLICFYFKKCFHSTSFEMCLKLTPYYDLTDEEGRGRNVKNIIFVWKEFRSKYT